MSEKKYEDYTKKLNEGKDVKESAIEHRGEHSSRSNLDSRHLQERVRDLERSLQQEIDKNHLNESKSEQTKVTNFSKLLNSRLSMREKYLT